MDLRKLKKLIDLVQESGIAELEITEGEEKVKIVKGGVVSVRAPRRHGDARRRARQRRGRQPPPAPPRRRERRPGGPCRQGADGRHLLPLAIARRQSRSSKSARR